MLPAPSRGPLLRVPPLSASPWHLRQIDGCNIATSAPRERPSWRPLRADSHHHDMESSIRFTSRGSPAGAQLKSDPPSTLRWAPVMYVFAAEAQNATTSAISAGSPILPRSTAEPYCSDMTR